MDAKLKIEPRLFSVKELARYMSLSVSSVYAMVEKKQIPFKRFGKKTIRFDRKEIDAWIDGHYNKSYGVG
ncbi:DNA-binding protein [candidate division KSB1 bacterium]|nr:MAG: DNA-binding protein [candidate division KSB1 bacterium]